jgi:TetR/AcrR family fatty acid metabolism transcriptional regulator
LCYLLTMRTKDTLDGQHRPTFTEVARRTQIIECAIETIATLGYAQASLAQIAKRASISTGVIVYYFKSREALLEQVVEEIYAAGAAFMRPQISAQATAAARLQTYIRANMAYIAAHRLQMMAIIEIVLNFRTEDGQLRYSLATEEPVLEDLEAILRQGQVEGSFRDFDLRVMAGTIRGAIDAAARDFVARPNLDGEAYARELAALFDRATRQE